MFSINSPQEGLHQIIQNLLYDISQPTIPFDQMDDEFLPSNSFLTHYLPCR